MVWYGTIYMVFIIVFSNSRIVNQLASMKCSTKFTATTLSLSFFLSISHQIIGYYCLSPYSLLCYANTTPYTHTHPHTLAHTDATQSVYCPISIDIHNLFCTFVGWRVRAGGAPPMKRVTCVLFNGLWPRKDKQLFRLIVYGIINWDRKAPTTTKLSWAITGKKKKKTKVSCA